LEKLKDLEYPKLYYSIKSTHEYIDALQGEYDSRAVMGFTTSSKTRPLIVAKLEEYIRNKLIRPKSSRLFNEFKTFIWNNGKPQAMRSYHDDLIMSLAIACWVRDTSLEVSKKEVEYQKAIVNSMYSTNKTLRTTIPGMREHNKTFEEKYEDEIKQTKEFVWIFKG
jgi:hypothetical protein